MIFYRKIVISMYFCVLEEKMFINKFVNIFCKKTRNNLQMVFIIYDSGLGDCLFSKMIQI